MNSCAVPSADCWERGRSSSLAPLQNSPLPAGSDLENERCGRDSFFQHRPEWVGALARAAPVSAVAVGCEESCCSLWFPLRCSAFI